jgi:hypothetical protein
MKHNKKAGAQKARERRLILEGLIGVLPAAWEGKRQFLVAHLRARGWSGRRRAAGSAHRCRSSESFPRGVVIVDVEAVAR